MAEGSWFLVDYEKQLLNKINEFGVGFPIYTDVNSSDSSISVASLPGSRTLQEYYDGIKDKEYIHEIQIKAKSHERDKATKALADIGIELDDVIDIPSQDGSYDFNNIVVTNEMFFSEATTDGFIYFKIQIKTLLTIY